MDTNFTADIMQIMYQYSRDKILTDFKIRAGNQKAHCHSAVLSAKSTYFKTICASGKKEATLGRSISKEEDSATLDTVIRYIYLGRSNITVHNVEKIVIAADFLYHEEMKSECENIMLQNLSVSKVSSYHKLSQKAGLSTLNTACLHLAKEKFTEIAHSTWFLDLTVDKAVEYLQADDLNAKTEDDVLYAIIRYIKNSNKTGTGSEQHTKRLLSCVRLKFCKRSTLESMSKDETIFDSLRLKIFEFLNHGRHGEGKARQSKSAAYLVSAASLHGAGAREKHPLPTEAATKVIPAASAKDARSSEKLSVTSHRKTKEEVVIVGGCKTGNKKHGNIVFLDKGPKDCIMTQAPLCAETYNSSVLC